MGAEIRSLQDLASKVSRDPALAESIKHNPAAALTDIATNSVLETDEWTYRIVVLSLGLAVLIRLLGLIVLSFKGIQSLPDGRIAIGSAGCGRISGTAGSLAAVG